MPVVMGSHEEGVVNLPYVSVAEELLGFDIYPSEILGSKQVAGEFAVDVRLYAHEVALSALAKQRGVPYQTFVDFELPPDTTMPKKAEIQAIRGSLGQHASELKRYVDQAHNLSVVQSSLEVSIESTPGRQARAEFQHRMIDSVIKWMQMIRLPSTNMREGDIAEVLQSGVVVVAPTGSGKTFIAAQILKACGIGKQLPGSKRTQSALVAVPTLELSRQFTSDREGNIFRETIGWGVPIGEYNGRVKNPKTVTVITHRSLQLAENRGDIRQGDFDVTVFDEIHHATAPKTYDTMRAICTNLVGLTATPAYDAQKDIRRWFPHLDGGTLREFIENEILNPARIFTFQGEDAHESSQIAAKLAVQWIKDGLRVVVYCQKGQHQLQARQVATMINNELGQKAVRPVGTFRGNTSEEDIEAFREGKLQGLTATNMLKEGWDEKIDGLIVVGPTYSTVDIAQVAGRALRPGDYVSRLAEIIPQLKNTNGSKASLWQLFGLEYVTQGELIGPSSLEGRAFDKLGGQSSMEEVPEDLRASLVQDGTPLRSVLIASERVLKSEEPPDGYIPLGDLAFLFGSTEPHVRQSLEAAEIPYVGVWVKIGRQKITERWFAPEAIDYLTAHPPLKIADPDALTMGQLCELTGLSRTFMEGLIGRRKLMPSQALRKDGYPAGLYSGESVSIILEEVDKIPFADLTDVPVGNLSKEMNETFVKSYAADHGFPLAAKRRNLRHGIKGITVHLTSVQADEIRREYRERSDTEGLMNLSDIAEEAEVNLATVSRNLLPSEREQIVNRSRRGEKGKEGTKGKFLPEDVALDIIKRIKVDILPCNLLPRPVLVKRSTLSETTLKRRLDAMQAGLKFIKIRGVRGEAQPCLDWQVVQHFEEQFPAKPGVLSLHFSRLPQSEDDDTRALYGRIVQAYYLGAAAVGDIMSELSDAAFALGITKPTLLHLLEEGEVESHKIGIATSARILPLVSGLLKAPPDMIAASDLAKTLIMPRTDLNTLYQTLKTSLPTYLALNQRGLGDLHFSRQAVAKVLKR